MAFLLKSHYSWQVKMPKIIERNVKDAVKKVLTSSKRSAIYFNMPVPAGYGTPTLDFIGCYMGYFFAVETKAPGKKPTARQNATIFEMEQTGAAVFVIDNVTTEALAPLERWLDTVETWSGRGKRPAQDAGSPARPSHPKHIPPP